MVILERIVCNKHKVCLLELGSDGPSRYIMPVILSWDKQTKLFHQGMIITSYNSFFSFEVFKKLTLLIIEVLDIGLFNILVPKLVK